MNESQYYVCITKEKIIFHEKYLTILLKNFESDLNFSHKNRTNQILKNKIFLVNFSSFCKWKHNLRLSYTTIKKVYNSWNHFKKLIIQHFLYKITNICQIIYFEKLGYLLKSLKIYSPKKWGVIDENHIIFLYFDKKRYEKRLSGKVY